MSSTPFTTALRHDPSSFFALRKWLQALPVLALALAGNAQAAADTWVGSAGSTDLNQATWTGGNATPLSGDSFIFTSANASVGTTLTNTLTAGFTLAGVTYNAGALAYTLGGNSFALTGDITNNGTNLETINNALSVAAVQTVTTTTGGGNVTLGGAITGAGGLTIAGTGTVTLSSATNAYTGNTTVNSGTLILSNATAGSGAIRGTLTINSGATVQTTVNNAFGYNIDGTQITQVNINGGTLTNASATDLGFYTNFTLTGGTINGTGAGKLLLASIAPNGSATKVTTLASSTTSTISAPIFLQSSASGNTTAIGFDTASGTAPGGIDLLISGIIGQKGTGVVGGITKLGAGTMQLSGVNTYTGPTKISAGTLSVATINNGGVAGNLGQAANTAANVVFDGGTLQYTGATASTDRSFTINAGKTATIEITTGANTLTISGASTATNGALTKIGAGTLTLSGTNLHTGLTTVSAGTLATGATGAFGAGDVTVAAGATLTLGNFTSINDTGALLVSSTSTVNLNFTTTGAETIGSLFSVTGSQYVPIGTYTVGQLNSNFGFGAGTFATIGAGTGTLTVTAVPEPSVLILMGAGIIVLTVFRRRRLQRY